MITDPYKVLGISPEATNDEIKKQYRKLSRIYHPDANINNPDKDKAEAKFKEIQQAYTQIMNMRNRSGNSDYHSYHSTRQDSQESNEMQAAFHYIRSGHFQEALHVLSQIEERNARWYYLSAAANAGAGNNILALDHAGKAVSMEPSNREYAHFLEMLQSGGTWYQSMGENYGYPSMNQAGECCYRLMIWNLFCGCCCRPC